MRIQIAQPTKHPDFLDLPWEQPLQDWQSSRIVEVARGISRHVVRFVNYGGAIYALKEIPQRIAEREFKMLRKLSTQQLPVVEPVGVIADRGGRGEDEMDAILMTRHLSYALPYRTLFSGRGIADLRASLLNALVDLLVRLHLAGFFWGDCSLSNTLFRRDAGGLAAYLVDAETGELHARLTDGQRRYDLEVAETNIAGELMDIEAGFGLPSGLDPVSIANSLPELYEKLWSELNREEVVQTDTSYLLDARIQRLNELGFDVKEVEYITAGRGRQVKLHTQVVERGYHQRQLQALTGLHVQENQARRLLNDICNYRANIDRDAGRALPMSVVAYRWLSEVFEPTIASIPQELRAKLESAELYHQLLDHRWFLSETVGRDVGREQAVVSFVEKVLRDAPDERGVAPLL
jgi:hypothetical protein